MSCVRSEYQGSVTFSPGIAILFPPVQCSRDRRTVNAHSFHPIEPTTPCRANNCSYHATPGSSVKVTPVKQAHHGMKFILRTIQLNILLASAFVSCLRSSDPASMKSITDDTHCKEAPHRSRAFQSRILRTREIRKSHMRNRDLRNVYIHDLHMRKHHLRNADLRHQGSRFPYMRSPASDRFVLHQASYQGGECRVCSST